MTDLDGKAPGRVGTGDAGPGRRRLRQGRVQRPAGHGLDGDTLYVADPENHAIRAVDLKAKTVTTVAGTGTAGAPQSAERYAGPGQDDRL